MPNKSCVETSSGSGGTFADSKGRGSTRPTDYSSLAVSDVAVDEVGEPT